MSMAALHFVHCPCCLLQGRLPEIEVLQKQISKAHEELSDLRFKLDEQRAAAATKEQQLNADKQQLQSQVEALSHQKERLQLEVDAAATRAANNEKQQQELYDLCNTLQGEVHAEHKCACLQSRGGQGTEAADSLYFSVCEAHL
jgi:chromosome segregation ATPase